MGVIGLEKTLAGELAPEVRFNSVLPGPIETERISDLIEQSVERGEFDSYEEGLEAKGSANPLGRIGRPMELGNTVAFLCSPETAYINGITVPIDGGSVDRTSEGRRSTVDREGTRPTIVFARPPEYAPTPNCFEPGVRSDSGVRSDPGLLEIRVGQLSSSATVVRAPARKHASAMFSSGA